MEQEERKKYVGELVTSEKGCIFAGRKKNADEDRNREIPRRKNRRRTFDVRTDEHGQLPCRADPLCHNAEDADEETRHDIVRLAEDWLEAKQSKDKTLEYDHEDIVDAVAEPVQSELFADFFKVPFPAPKHPKFTFIDLFAGIGGFRIAMQNLGGKCIYSSEFDSQAQKTYFANYGDMPFGDITKESTKSFIPNEFDVLCAGFPCQAFSNT